MPNQTSTSVTEASRQFLAVSQRLPTIAPLYSCDCGCGQTFRPRIYRGRTQRFVLGHNGRERRSPDVGYGEHHRRVGEARGTPQLCAECGETDPSKRYEWANLTGNYADPLDYKRLCKACHNRFDNVGQRSGITKTGRPRLDMQGSRHRLAKLSEADVIAIRSRHARGESLRALRDQFGISDTHIRRIVLRNGWKHLS